MSAPLCEDALSARLLEQQAEVLGNTEDARRALALAYKLGHIDGKPVGAQNALDAYAKATSGIDQRATSKLVDGLRRSQ